MEPTVSTADTDESTETTVESSATETSADTTATTASETTVTTKGAVEAATLYGDINLDGRVDITDAVLLNKAAANAVSLSAQQQANADCDESGEVDSRTRANKATDIRCEAVKKVLFSVEGEQDFLSPCVRRNQGNTA